MNNNLYSGQGIACPNKARQWIEANGGKIVRERMQHFLSGPLPQFHVLADGEYWVFEPNRTHGYDWQRLRKACRCGLPCCACKPATTVNEGGQL